MGLGAGGVLLLFPDAANVGHVSASLDHMPGSLIAIALVQTQILGRLVGRFGPLRHDRLQRCCRQEMVIDIGTGNHQSQRAAVSLDKQALLDAKLPTARGVGADPKRAVFRLVRAGDAAVLTSFGFLS